MKKILIFKTDKIGDLINISPLLNNLKINFPDCEIDLVCSNYNFAISKYYTILTNIFIYNKPIIFFLFSNYKFFFLKKYDLILQLDGKNHSYLSAFFIRSSTKACIKFIKKKKIFYYNFINHRPNFFLSFIFNCTVKCNEDYSISNNLSFHYSTLHLELLKKLDFKIFSKKHFLPFNPNHNKYFNDYTLIHIDEKWSKPNINFYVEFKKKIYLLAKKKNILITCNLNGNNFFDKLSKDLNLCLNIKFVNKSSLNELINIIYYSHTVISIHSGLIVHAAASFNKKIIDIIEPEIFDEVDRWIPYKSQYFRFNFENFFKAKF